MRSDKIFLWAVKKKVNKKCIITEINMQIIIVGWRRMMKGKVNEKQIVFINSVIDFPLFIYTL